MWDLPFRANDLWERVKLVAGWLGLSGFLSAIFGAFWAWLCGMTVWWPFFAAVAVGSYFFLKAGWATWQTKREAQESDALKAKVQLMLEVIEASKRQGAGPSPNPQPVAAPGPTNRVMTAETGKFDLTGFQTTLTHAPSEYLPLRDAMRQAYERTLTGTLSAFANGQADGNPEEVLNWYAYFSLNHLPIYGKRAPSTVPELFKPELINRYYFLGGGTALAPKGNGPAYTDLSVKRGELAAFFNKLVALDAEFAEVFS